MKSSHQLGLFKGSDTGTVAVAFAALLLVLGIPPMFMIPIGSEYYAGRVGAVVGFVAVTIATWAFLICPRRPVPKALTFAFLVPTLYFGFRYVSTYFAYRPHP
jgi:hypothetical protein